jgi:hypothetical protein
MARRLISWSIEVPNGDWEGGDRNDDEQQTLRESCQARWALPRRFVLICGPSASHTEPLKTLRFLAMGKRKATSRTKPSARLKRVLTEAGRDKVKVVVNFQHGQACQIETNLIIRGR